MDTLFFVGRIIVGLYFAMMGLNHFMKMGMMRHYASSRGLPAAGLGVVVTGIVILFAGLGVLLGSFVTLSLWSLIAFLVLTAFSIHHFWTDQGMDRMKEKTNFTKNFALAAALLMVLTLL